MSTLPLFDDEPPRRTISGPLPPVPPVPYQRGSETSEAGAKAVRQAAAAQCQRLLQAYQEHGDLTDAEAAFFLNLDRSTVIPIRHVLMTAGQVIEKGSRQNPVSGVANKVYGVK